MDYRVENIVRALQKLPTPHFDGQIHQIQVPTELWEQPPLHVTESIDEAKNQSVSLITLKAVRFGKGRRGTWLEWTMDI